MDARGPDSRFVRGLQLMGYCNAVWPRASIAKPGDQHQGVRDVVRFIEPEQEATGRVHVDLLHQESNARCMQHGPMKMRDEFLDEIAGPPGRRNDQSASVDF